LRRSLSCPTCVEELRVEDAIIDESIRIGHLSWAELIAEHEAAGAPSGPVEEAAHDLRARLLESE
jgi:hypothetical protein